MFYLAALFLVGLAVMLPHGAASEPFSEKLLGLSWFFPWFFVGLWGLIVLESLIGLFQAPDGWCNRLGRFLLVTLVPPMRMAFSTARPNRDVWFPRAGWLPVSEDSSEVMEVVLAIPMLFITLAILPVLGVELLLDDLVARHVELGIALHLVTAMIWFAFVVEFILLVGVAEKKIAFCRQHWVNIVIIVLPLIAFLRLLRLTRLVRLIRAGKMIRMYRIRGIYARALRVAVLFNLVERILRRNPEGYLRRLETRIAEKEKELASLQEEADEVRAELAEWRAATGERETGRAHSGPA